MTELNQRYFMAERAAWQLRFANAIDSSEATWALAELQERWGDWLARTERPGAAGHFREAQQALIPPGARFESREDNDRRMAAHQRITERLYALPPEIAHPKEAPQALFERLDHWTHYALGVKWREAGDALSPVHSYAARRAYAWSLRCFELYNRAWNAHGAASRWDSDGGEDIVEVQALLHGLPESASEDVLPAWVDAALAGEWRRGRSLLSGQQSEPEFQSVGDVLGECCRAIHLLDDSL